MKKFIIIFFVLFLSLAILADDGNFKKSFSILVGGGMRNLNSRDYEDIYGKNNIVYTFDISYDLAKQFELFLHSDYLSSKGKLTYTQEETTIEIVPVEIGLRISSKKGSFRPFFGVGAGYYTYSEENIMGKIEEAKSGFFGEGGFRYYFGKMFFSVFGKYVVLKVSPQSEVETENATLKDEEVDFGGLLFGFGVGYRF